LVPRWFAHGKASACRRTPTCGLCRVNPARPPPAPLPRPAPQHITTPAATIGIDDARADWLDDAERATALRQAGQFELLVDQQHARSLLLDAAQSYLRAGVPYGHFLATAFSVDVAPPILFSGPGRLVWPLVHASQAVSPPTTEPTEPPEPGPLGPDALLDWVQQAYVYLVVNAHRPLWQEFRHVIAPCARRRRPPQSRPSGRRACPSAPTGRLAISSETSMRSGRKRAARCCRESPPSHGATRTPSTKPGKTNTLVKPSVTGRGRGPGHRWHLRAGRHCPGTGIDASVRL
jgi:hypothetical protein